MGNLAIGAHVGGDDPIAGASALGLDHIQIFLADPQGWKNSVVPHPDGAQGLKASAEKANIDIYVHARYIINVATTNNKVRIPSRKLLQTDVDAAASVGAATPPTIEPRTATTNIMGGTTTFQKRFHNSLPETLLRSSSGIGGIISGFNHP